MFFNSSGKMGSWTIRHLGCRRIYTHDHLWSGWISSSNRDPLSKTRTSRTQSRNQDNILQFDIESHSRLWFFNIHLWNNEWRSKTWAGVQDSQSRSVSVSRSLYWSFSHSFFEFSMVNLSFPLLNFSREEGFLSKWGAFDLIIQLIERERFYEDPLVA